MSPIFTNRRKIIIMQEYTLFAEGTLPSLGKLYKGRNVNPEFKIRSMTTEEEMRRLSHSEKPLKVLCEIIDGCLIDNPFDGLSSYDMCLGDYQYLLHKLRVATYGSSYKMNTYCPICGANEKQDVDIESLEHLKFTEDIFGLMSLTLPVTKVDITLKYQTPRSVDATSTKKKDFEKRMPDSKVDQTLLFTICSIVDTVKSEHLDPFKLENWVRKLPMQDTNVILKRADKIDSSIGLKADFEFTCGVCGNNFRSPFLITNEFWGPDEDQ